MSARSMSARSRRPAMRSPSSLAVPWCDERCRRRRPHTDSGRHDVGAVLAEPASPAQPCLAVLGDDESRAVLHCRPGQFVLDARPSVSRRRRTRRRSTSDVVDRSSVTTDAGSTSTSEPDHDGAWAPGPVRGRHGSPRSSRRSEPRWPVRTCAARRRIGPTGTGCPGPTAACCAPLTISTAVRNTSIGHSASTSAVESGRMAWNARTAGSTDAGSAPACPSTEDAVMASSDTAQLSERSPKSITPSGLSGTSWRARHDHICVGEVEMDRLPW